MSGARLQKRGDWVSRKELDEVKKELEELKKLINIKKQKKT